MSKQQLLPFQLTLELQLKLKTNKKKMKELNQGRHQIPKAKQTKGSPWYTGARWAFTAPESAPEAGQWLRAQPGRWGHLPKLPGARSRFCRVCPQSKELLGTRSKTGPWAAFCRGLSSRGELDAATLGKRLCHDHPPDLVWKELSCCSPFVPVFFPMHPLSAALYEGWPDTLLALAEPCLSLVQFQHWL